MFQSQKPQAVMRLPEVPSKLWNESGKSLIYDISWFCHNASVSVKQNNVQIIRHHSYGYALRLR
jgi:hypothetical protein